MKSIYTLFVWAILVFQSSKSAQSQSTSGHPENYSLIQISPYGSIIPITLLNNDFGTLGLAGAGINAEYHLPHLLSMRGDFSYHIAMTNDLNGYKSENKSLTTYYIGGTYHLIERLKSNNNSSRHSDDEVLRIFGPRATYGHQGFGEGSFKYAGLGFDLTSVVHNEDNGNETKTLYAEAVFGKAEVAAPGLPFNENGTNSMSKSTKGFQLGFRSTSWFGTGLYIDLAVGYPMLFSGKMGVALNYKRR